MSVYLSYYPCFDGYYSTLNAFFFFRDTQKDRISSQDFINYMSQFNNLESINQNIYEFAKKPQPKPKPIIPSKSKKAKEAKPENLLPSAVSNLMYVPIRVIPNSDFYFPYEHHNPEKLKNSILLLMGNYPNTLKAVQELSQSFRQIIVIDYHMANQKAYEKFVQEKDYPSNIFHLFNSEKSIATLTLEFFEKLKGSPLLLDSQNQSKLQQILGYIEDSQRKKNLIPESERFVSGLLICNKHADYNPRFSQGAYKLLFDVKIEHLLNVGRGEVDEKVDRAQNIIFKERCVLYLGGKTSDDKGKYGQCYAVKTYETGLRKELLKQLAGFKSQDMSEGIGAIFRKDRENLKEDIWIISLQFLQRDKNFHKLAKEYPESVFRNSMEIYLPFEELRKWTPVDYFPKIEI